MEKKKENSLLLKIVLVFILLGVLALWKFPLLFLVD